MVSEIFSRAVTPAGNDSDSGFAFNFDEEKSAELKEVGNKLIVRKKYWKERGLGNKQNEAQPLEDDQIEKMWSTGAIGLQNRLLHLV